MFCQAFRASFFCTYFGCGKRDVIGDFEGFQNISLYLCRGLYWYELKNQQAFRVNSITNFLFIMTNPVQGLKLPVILPLRSL